jgi:hypothetical protein
MTYKAGFCLRFVRFLKGLRLSNRRMLQIQRTLEARIRPFARRGDAFDRNRRLTIGVKKKLHGLSPRENYTDRATAACR